MKTRFQTLLFQTPLVPALRIGDCPKLGNYKEKQISSMGQSDVFGAGGFGGEF
jgi:hypothetical protein